MMRGTKRQVGMLDKGMHKGAEVGHNVCLLLPRIAREDRQYMSLGIMTGLKLQ